MSITVRDELALLDPHGGILVSFLKTNFVQEMRVES